MKRPIEVLIVDDSYLWANALAEVLEGDSEIRVVDRVTDGEKGLEATSRLSPDLVLMDLQMPILGGLEAISRIMAHAPTPILVMTGQSAGRCAELTFEALRRGALDLMVKDITYPPPIEFVERLRRKVKMLSRVRVVRHVDSERGVRAPSASAAGPAVREPSQRRIGIVAIVASTGGPAALSSILRGLPKDFAVPIVVVQHLAAGFASTFASWLDSTGALAVRLAEDGDRLRRGEVLVAPDDHHLRVRANATVALDRAPAEAGHRPSGNLLFDSVAKAYGAAALGLILTGMGEDGVRGLLELRQAGARTLAQDQASSVVFGMPAAAARAGAVVDFIALEEIPGRLDRLANGC